MTLRLNPARVAAPTGPFSHGIAVDGPGRWLHVSGQIGIGVDGKLADDIAGQATQAWENLLAVLSEAGMGVEHLVKLTTYLVDSAHLAVVNPIRGGYLGEARPASTLIVAKELAKAEWLFEIEAVAFKAA